MIPMPTKVSVCGRTASYTPEGCSIVDAIDASKVSEPRAKLVLLLLLEMLPETNFPRGWNAGEQFLLQTVPNCVDCFRMEGATKDASREKCFIILDRRREITASSLIWIQTTVRVLLTVGPIYMAMSYGCVFVVSSILSSCPICTSALR